MSCSIFRLLFIEPLNRALPLPLSALPLSLRVLIPLAWSGKHGSFLPIFERIVIGEAIWNRWTLQNTNGKKKRSLWALWLTSFIYAFFFFPLCCSKLDAITGGCFQSFCSCLFIWSRGYVCKAFLISSRPWNNAVTFQCWWRRVLKMFL